MTASISLNDGGGPVIGSQDNGTLGASVDVSNADDSGVLGWRWEMAYKPPGSSVSAPSGSVATFNFVPDVRGTYLIRLTTYTDAARANIDDADEQCYAVRLETPFDWRVPAAGETTQYGASGWAPAREAAIRQMHGFMTSGIAAHPGTVDRDLNAPNVEVVLGGFVYDGSRLPATGGWLRLIGRLSAPDPGAELELRLYDLGEPGSPIVPVLRATATVDGDVSNSDVGLDDVALAVVASPGVGAAEIANTRRIYELRGIIVGTAASAKILWGGIALDGA